MKILISSLTYPLPNGVTVSINTSVNGLIARGYQIVIVSPRYNKENSRLEHRQVPSSFAVKTIGSLIGKQERTFGMTAFYQIEKIIKEFNPDLYWLHTVTWAPNAFEKQMLKSDKPKILHYHTLVEEYGRIYGKEFGADLMRKRSKYLANKADIVITPSRIIEKKLRQYGVEKPIEVIPTAIPETKKYFTKKELCQKFKIPLDSKVLFFVGRVCKEKNIESLLRTIKEIKKKNEKIYLLIVGPGEIETFKGLAEKMGVADRVIFGGAFPLAETRKMYGASDLFVFASKTETQGIVIGEAMMARIPIVAFDSLIQPEIYPEDTAIVIRNEADFPSAILEILSNLEKRKKMISRAREFVINNFSEKEVTKKQEKVFLNLYNQAKK